MASQIKFRRGTAAQWTAANPTLAAGEPGFETDTGQFKIGDGTTAWASLEYAGGASEIVEDTTPQLGGDLDLNSNDITGTGNITIAGNVSPTTDVTYDLGSSSYRWRDLYLSGSTIDLGGAKITTNDDTGVIAFVPPVTVSNPNPSALVVSPTGTISVAVTSAGVVETANIQASAPSLPPKISSVEVTDSGGTVLDDTAVDTAGGYIKITGSNFVSGCSVLIGTTPATSTTFVSSTVLTVQVPAAAAGSYILYVVNPDGATAIKINGVTYSVAPTWVTSSSLPDAQSGQAYSQSLSATDAISYSLDGGSSLPSGMTLTSVGLLSGTSTVVNSTNYSFTVLATDAENQDSPRTFSLNVSTEPELGSFYNGGYYAGRIVIDGYIYRIILSPKSSGQSYRQLSNYSSAYLYLNQSGRSVTLAQTRYDGWHVTNTMASTGHYLGASWARGLTINGYNDWYLPSLWEMWLCYVTFKPTTANNYAGNASPWNGYNPYTRVPGWPANTAVSSQNPSQTSITEFQNSGAQAFVYGGSSNSTLYFTTNKIIETGSQYVVSFDSGDNQAGRGFENNGYWSVGQTEYINLRVIRRELVGPE